MNIPLYHLQATIEVSEGEEIDRGFDDQKQNYVLILKQMNGTFPKWFPHRWCC